MSTNRALAAACALSSLVLAAALPAAQPQPKGPATPAVGPVTPMTPDVVATYEADDKRTDYIKRVAMIPMRDGVKLYTVIAMKKGVQGGPILLTRTPYDAKGAADRTASTQLVEILPIMDSPFVKDGYIRVYQDIRGLHNSEGAYVMNRPLRGPLNDTKVDESTDAFDTIDWLVKNVPESNGRVGIIGSSYPGFTVLMAEIDAHPALKAAVPQSPMVDGWMGDDWFHNGAFRNPNLSYVVGQSTNKAEGGRRVIDGNGDDYSRFLAAGSTGDYARARGIDHYPFMRKVMENPAYTPFWSLQAVDKLMAARSITVPTMLIVGQWDQEDSYGAPAVYRALEPKDRNNDQVSLVIGPWRHSGVNHYGSDLGALGFTGDTALEFRTRWLKPFLDHHLKGAPDPHTPPVLTYATGVNRWEVSQQWPAGTPRALYLVAGGKAAFTAPTGSAGEHDEFVSDPAKPVPFLPRPVAMDDGAQWQTWLVRDQRFVSDRPDVLVYETAPLDQPLHVMGAPQVELFAATTGTDADWVLKLVDVYPDETPEPGVPSNSGFELPVGIEIFRGRYVHGFDQPQALVPGKVEEYKFGLPNVDHVFLPGHRLMVQVQSTLFPLYDRNPQSFVPNIFNAKPGDYRKATHSVFRAPGAASAVWLPVAAQ
jgi:putative CocE/NonD family hydrolase